MYRNLEAELKRNGITRSDVAKVLKVNVATASEKLTKPGRLKFFEAEAIRKQFFHDLSLEYLFETTQ